MLLIDRVLSRLILRTLDRHPRSAIYDPNLPARTVAYQQCRPPYPLLVRQALFRVVIKLSHVAERGELRPATTHFQSARRLIFVKAGRLGVDWLRRGWVATARPSRFAREVLVAAAICARARGLCGSRTLAIARLFAEAAALAREAGRPRRSAQSRPPEFSARDPAPLTILTIARAWSL